MKNLPVLVNAGVMLVLLLGGGGMSVYVMATSEVRTAMFKPYPGVDYVNGKLTSTIEGTYKDELPLKDRSVNLLNAVTLALFEEGRKGVVVGSAGWLFSAEEYDWTPRSAQNLAANIDAIAKTAAQLRARGIALEIALVPEKADIYATLLRRPRPEEHIGKYEAIRQMLVARTVTDVPDLRAVLLAGSTDGDVYFPTDTHWSVEGAGLAAQALAGAFPPLADVPPAQYALTAQPPVHHDGDLLNFLELGPFKALLPHTEDEVVPLTASVDSAGIDDLLGDSAAAAPDIILVGTSYSANALWSFEPQLKAALGKDVLNLAEQGHGPFVPMAKTLQQIEAGTLHPRALIWEIPVRYLDDDMHTQEKTAI